MNATGLVGLVVTVSGEIRLLETGGVEDCPKKTASDLSRLRLLQIEQQATKLSRSHIDPPLTTAIT